MTAVTATCVVAAPALGALLASRASTGAQALRRTLPATVLALGLLLALAAWGEHGVAVAWRWGFGVTVGWRVDAASLALGAMVAGVSAVVLPYAATYLGDGARAARTLALLSVFEAAMLGVVLADDLLLLYVCWELTGVCSYFLVLTDADRRDDAAPAARQALLVTSGAALPMVIGFLVLAGAGGTSSLSELTHAGLSAPVRALALALVLPGALAKSAQVPLHGWLPAAMVAPTPVSALLHSATMVKAGVILLVTVQPLFADLPLWTGVLVPVGAVTCVWGSVRALGVYDLKALLAWSTISQLGLVVLTLGLATPLALRAAVLHLIAHALFKGGLFLAAGAVDKATGTRDLRELGGLGGAMPALFAATAVLGMSMAGLPPTLGYLSKELVVGQGLAASGVAGAAALAGIALGSVGTVAYTARFVLTVFLGPAVDSAPSRARGLVAGPVWLAVGTLAAGLAAASVDRGILAPIVTALWEAPDAKPLALWHGVDATVGMSLGIVAAGLLLYRRLGRAGRLVAVREGERPFDVGLRGAKRLGATLDELLSGLGPTAYFAIAVALALGPALVLLPEALAVAPGAWQGSVTVVVVLQAALLVAMVAQRGQLTLVLLVTGVGLTVALLFRLMEAPDLALTQLLVDLVTSVLLVLAVRLQGTTEPAVTFSGAARWAAVAVSAAAGLASFAVVRVVLENPAPDAVRAYVYEAGPELAKGRNLVNVILTDLRALDTFAETLVVGVSALGVLGVLLGRELGSAGTARGEGRRREQSFLLASLGGVLAVGALLIALSLLVKGHDDPGGGFVAGVGLALAVVLVLVSLGSRWLRRNLGFEPERAVLAGAGAMWVVAVIPAVAGGAALTQGAIGLPLPGGVAPQWHSTLLFDAGVALCVGGALGTAALVMWERLQATTGDAP